MYNIKRKPRKLLKRDFKKGSENNCWIEINIGKCINLFKKGNSLFKISKEINISVETIRNRLITALGKDNYLYIIKNRKNL